MPLYKSSQHVSEILNDVNNADVPHTHLGDGEDEVILYEEKPSPEDVIEIHDEHSGDNDMAITFKLPNIPGAPDDVIEVSSDDALEVEEPEEKEDKNDAIEVRDPWDWASMPKSEFMGWVYQMLKLIPPHSGNEVFGIQRTIAFLKKIINEMSKAAQQDYKGEINIGELEKVRNEILDGIERLEKRETDLSKKREKKSSDNSMVKEGQKQTAVGGIIVTVPILISRIARVCINGMVSGGHDIEDLFDRQIKKYKLNDREQAEVMQLLSDMGYALRRDRGFLLNEDLDTTSTDNMDWNANYPS